MQFRLVYQGRLRSNGNAAHKQEIRRALHPQLRELWRHPPLEMKAEFLADSEAEHSLSVIERVGDFRFAPLVCDKLKLLAEIEIVLLRAIAPGALIRTGGDIDNQLKTLFDALKCPQRLNELPVNDAPGEEEDPFFTLLDDDERIVDLRVSVDRLLAVPEDPRAVHATLFVRTRPSHVIHANLPLS